MVTWEISIRAEAPFFAGHSGRSLVDVVWAQSVRAEAALQDDFADNVVVSWLWDLIKAYEHVDHSCVVKEAFEEARNPFAVVRLALNTYRMARRFLLQGAVSDEVFRGRGIIAGCSHATVFLKLTLARALRALLLLLGF